MSTSYAAIVLAAGQGSRMNSNVPKVLHRICGTEMISLVVEAVVQSNITHITLIVPPDHQAIDALFDSQVNYAVQNEAYGTGHALLQNQFVLNKTKNILVVSGDVPLIHPNTIRKMINLHSTQKACITLLTSNISKPHGFGRILRSPEGKILSIVEEKQAYPDKSSLTEINAGAYCFNSPWLENNLSDLKPSNDGEFLITDLISVAVDQGLLVNSVNPINHYEVFGVNDRKQLSEVETTMRKLIRDKWMVEGVTIPDPLSVYIDAKSTIAKDTIIYPNTHILGNSTVGIDCELGPNSIIRNSTIGDSCLVLSSIIQNSTIDEKVHIGPFAHIRMKSHLQSGVYLGSHVEVKASEIGHGTKSGHFSYIGDAIIGSNVNIGAGTITCNYDGVEKHTTVIGDNVFIGSDSLLIAPITLGDRSTTGAGAVVTKDVPPDSKVLGIPARDVGSMSKSLEN